MYKLKLLLATAFCWVFSYSFAQKITFDPIDWKENQPLKITFDLTATSFHNFSGNLYLWSWFLNPAGQGIDSPNNGTWTASSAASQLTNLGSNKWSITITPNAYLGIHPELLKIQGFNFLIKNIDGTVKTEGYGPIKPWLDGGIKYNTCWGAKRKISLVVDVSSTPLNGNAGPLYYWGWYNNGTGDLNAAQNGTWSASSAQSAMTQIATNVWKITLDAPAFFGTTASNLSASTIFGLIKTADGSLKTGDFGVGKAFKPYQIYQSPLSKVVVTPANPADNVPVTIKFIAQDDMVGYTDRAYFHAGLTTSSISSENWDRTPTNWEDTTTTSNALMTNVATNEWQITIPSIRSYFGLASGETAFKINARMRTKSGGFSEGDGCDNATIFVNNPNYLELREPAGSILVRPINEPFRITGATALSSNYTIQVNGTTIATENGVSRSSITYTPTAAGVYTITVSSVNAGVTLTKTVNVTVCGTTSIASAAALPAGLKYGINYNPADATKATLVLHAPTENIKSVFIIGDFNSWAANCNYLMSWDATKKVFWKEITGLTAGQEYVFQYLIDGKTRIADPYTTKISDPWNDASIPTATYPSLIQYPAGAKPTYGETNTLASVLKTNPTVYNWQVTNFNRPAHNKLNTYQLHFRDFTVEGTYLAAIQKLDYLKRMGINAIETLPVSEFEGNNSWGYNPNFYFAVDKAYGKEEDYKLFVDECHKRGIAVIGDVVLNHAFGTNSMARMYWNDINSRPESNNPWFNIKTNFDNPGANWGNDFNHQSPHTQAFVDSVSHYWMTQFKIDGIRFDFTKGFGNTPYPNAGCGDPWGGCYDAARIALLKRMATKMWAINNGSTGSAPIVIFEHLAELTEDKELADFGVLLWSGVNPNQKYSEIAMGYAPTATDPNKSDVSSAYYKNKTFNFANWVSYMESHDEERIAYRAKNYGNGSVATNLAVRSQFLQSAAVMNLLFPGARMVWQFGELGYDYSIDYNQRTGKKPIRWDYFDVPERKKIYETYSKLFWLRNAMPVTFHRDLDNSSSRTDFVSQFKRFHFYNAVGDTAVTVIANTANSIISGNPMFNSTATSWFEFNTGQIHSYSTPATASVTLQPGEFRIYINKVPTQAPPAIVLTSPITVTVGNDTTNIKLSFDKEMTKTVIGSMLGTAITPADISSMITLKNASNVAIPFAGSISFNQKEITINPAATLPVGTYTITLLADSTQNYGGLKISTPTVFTFTVQATLPCEATKVYTSTADDAASGSLTKQVSNSIQATNSLSGTARTEYDAKRSVQLNPGFKANPATGGVFTAKIGGCN
jgi:glycosidase